MSETPVDVILRQIDRKDLPTLFEYQLDVESNQMAFTHPRSEEEFARHWDESLLDPKVVVRAIVVGDSIAGCIACFQ